jgi:hypothetical protein
MSIVIGAKGSGKSALFEYMTKWGDKAKQLGGDRLRNKIIVGATGFGDIRELSTNDIEQINKFPEFSFERLWTLYIAIKSAFAIAEQGYSSKGALRDFLRAASKVNDYRILPILTALWRSVIGSSPEAFTISAPGFGSIQINSGKRSIDVYDLLSEINDSLAERGEEVWLLFDKVDELLAGNHELRNKAVQNLVQTHFSIMRNFPNIRMKIFCRTDIWRQLIFVNKSHTIGKIVEMKWNEDKLLRMLMKRAMVSDAVRRHANYGYSSGSEISFDDIGYNDVEMIFYKLFDRTVYPRKNVSGQKSKKEAELYKWMLDRSKDGEGNIYPREMINFCNVSVGIQREMSRSARQEGARPADILISGSAVKESYYTVSKIRCETYLAEFPNLRKHFRRFAGQSGTISKAKLFEIMDGLEPKGEEMIQWLCDIVGVLTPAKNKHWTVADDFEVPRLYRAGLELVLKGRP